MTREDFNQGLNYFTKGIPVKLAGALWDYYKTDDGVIWMKSCQRLAKEKLEDLEFSDFLESVMKVRREECQGHHIADVAADIVKKIDQITGKEDPNDQTAGNHAQGN